MINELFKELSQDQRDALVSAFNEQKDGIVVLEDGRFLAVFLERTDDLIIDEENNNWICGRIPDD